ncbi:MAG: hypothetical protein HY646_05970 [Acidobacteria bacterium]|nr:hypothetical protein [Acidobacteriota bacterium]
MAVEDELARLEELFYLEVGSAHSLSLEGFASKAMEHYALKIQRGVKVFKFDSLGVSDSLTLVVNSNPTPYLAAVVIRQVSPGLDMLLDNLHGEVEVDYCGINARVPQGIRHRRSGGKLTKLTIPRDSRYDTVRQHILSFGEGFRKLVVQGECLSVKTSDYADDDPRKCLVHTHCLIRRAVPRYSFEYSLHTANLDPLPLSFVQAAEVIFSLAKPYFQKLSVYKARVSPFRGVDAKAD